MLERERAKGPLLVLDAGAALAPPDRAAIMVEGGRELEQRRIKARLIAEALVETNLDAAALSAQDWTLGTDFVRQLVAETKYPVLAANLVCQGERPFPGSKVIEAGGARIGLIGFTDGEVEGCQVESLVQAAERERAALAGVDLVIALAPLQKRDALTALGAAPGGIDLILDARGGHASGPPERFGRALAYGAGTRGKMLGLLSVEWVAGATGLQSVAAAPDLDRLKRNEERLAELNKLIEDPATSAEQRLRYEAQRKGYQSQIDALRTQLREAAAQGVGHKLRAEELPLDAAAGEHGPTQSRVAAALQSILTLEGGAIQYAVEPRVAPPDSPYAGSDTCKSCHPAEHAQWLTTPHANAWQVLVEEQRHLDRDCFSCHATGVGRPGGPQAPGEVVGLRDVQCEACHSALGRHVQHPDVVKAVAEVPLSVCTECHDGKQDGGRFDPATYLPKVMHRPAAE